MNQYWKKGSVLHREAPFLAMITKDNVRTHCTYCFKKLDVHKVRKCLQFFFRVRALSQHVLIFHLDCVKCKLARYCSQECLDRDSETHHEECSLFGKCLPYFDTVRMIIKLIFHLNRRNGWKDYEMVFQSKNGECKVARRKFSDLLRYCKNDSFLPN